MDHRASGDKAIPFEQPEDPLWFGHPGMQARVTQAEKDFAEGRSTRTQTPEDAQALLDSLKQRPGQ